MWKVCKSQRLPLFPKVKSYWDLNQKQLMWLQLHVQIDELEDDLKRQALFDEKAGEALRRLRQGDMD
jgi:hypothetical protein